VTAAPNLSNSMVAAVAATQASSSSDQKRATIALDAVFATMLSKAR
jgi:hypothetical protein